MKNENYEIKERRFDDLYGVINQVREKVANVEVEIIRKQMEMVAVVTRLSVEAQNLSKNLESIFESMGEYKQLIDGNIQNYFKLEHKLDHLLGRVNELIGGESAGIKLKPQSFRMFVRDHLFNILSIGGSLAAAGLWVAYELGKRHILG